MKEFIIDEVKNMDAIIEHEDYDALKECIIKTRKEVSEEYNNGRESLNEKIMLFLDHFRILVSEYVKKRNFSFLFGRHIGYMEGVNSVLENDIKSAYNAKIVSELKNLSSAHFDEIIRILYYEDAVRHGVLAEKVGVDKSTLTGIMDKLEKSEYIVSVRPGKFKYYYLSDSGKKYYIENQKKMIKPEDNIDIKLNDLLYSLSKTSDYDDKFDYVLDQLRKHKYKMDSEKSVKQPKPAKQTIQTKEQFSELLKKVYRNSNIRSADASANTIRFSSKFRVYLTANADHSSESDESLEDLEDESSILKSKEVLSH